MTYDTQDTGGDTSQATNDLPELYEKLRELASHHFHRQRRDHTLQPTALVHEVFMRLVRGKKYKELHGTDLLKMAARAMRSVLVDHARRKTALKRQAPGHRVPIEFDVSAYVTEGTDVTALDEALERLFKLEPQWGTIVELRFFGGYGEEEIATLLGLTPRTVRRHWRMAKAWLRNEIEGGREDGE